MPSRQCGVNLALSRGLTLCGNARERHKSLCHSKNASVLLVLRHHEFMILQPSWRNEIHLIAAEIFARVNIRIGHN